MTKISDLSDGGTLQSTDELIVVRSGGNARAKMNTLPDMTVSQSPSVPSSSAQIFYNSTKGAVLRGQGSTSDVTIENDAGQTALTVGTGTQSVGIGGTASASYTLDVIKAGAIATRARSTDDSDVSQFFYSQGTTATQNIYFGDSANTAAAGLRYFHSTDNLTFTGKGAGSEMARFNSSGYFSVGGSGGDKMFNVYHTSNATTGAHIENLSNGSSARASITLRSDGGFCYLYATGSAYIGVASWQDSAVLTSSSQLSGGIKISAVGGGIQLQDNFVNRLDIKPSGELVINEDSNDRDFRVESNSLTHALYVDAGNGRVGINNAAPAQALDVGGNVNCVGLYSQSLYVTAQGGAGVTQGDIRISSATTSSPGTRGQGVFVFNHGTDTTWYSGTIYGDGDRYQIGFAAGTSLNVDAARSSAGALNMYTDSTGVVFNDQGIDRDFKIESDNNSNMFRIDASNDRVLIGTSDVGSGTLHVYQAATGTETAPHLRLQGSNYSAYHFLDTSAYHIGQNSGSRTVRIYSGAETAGVQLAASATSWSTFSDERLKFDVEPIDNALETLSELRTVSYRLEGVDSPTDPKKYGVVAQDLVGQFDDLIDPMHRAGDDTEYMGVRYTELVPVIIRAMQQQTDMINQLQAQVAEFTH